MTYRGRIQAGVVVLESPNDLAEGTEVEVSVPEKLPPIWAEVFKDVIGTVEGLPDDSSENHDHYLYGTKKKP